MSSSTENMSHSTGGPSITLYALNQQCSPLLRIPTELLMMIYEFAIGGNTHYLVSKESGRRGRQHNSDRKASGFNLVQACRQIHAETKTLPVRLTEFFISKERMSFLLGPPREWNIPELRNNLTSLTVFVCYQEGPWYDDLRYLIRKVSHLLKIHGQDLLIAPALQNLLIRTHYRVTVKEQEFPTAIDLAAVAELDGVLAGLRGMLPQVKISMELLKRWTHQVVYTWQ